MTGSEYLENSVRSNKFSTSYGYDKHGNILSLSRCGNRDTTTYGVIDELSLTYQGNQLRKVEDAASKELESMPEFKNKKWKTILETY